MDQAARQDQSVSPRITRVRELVHTSTLAFAVIACLFGLARAESFETRENVSVLLPESGRADWASPEQIHEASSALDGVTVGDWLRDRKTLPEKEILLLAENVAEALRSVAERAGARSVTVCMETHDDWCNPEHVARVMRRVNAPAIAVNWDIMHPIRRGGVTMTEAFDVLQDWVRHIHFHDGANAGSKFSLVPIGQGEIDHQCAVRLLQEQGYEGYLSGEWINWESYQTHLPRELATMKSYEQTGG